MKQLVMIPFVICLFLPALIIGFCWKFISEGFACGQEKADESVDDL